MADAGGCKDADVGAAKNQVLNHDRHNVREHGPSAGQKKRGKADAVQNQVLSFLGYMHPEGADARAGQSEAKKGVRFWRNADILGV